MARDSKKQETAFERKLKEIEQEKRRVQNEIKSLSKAMKRGEVPPSPSVARTPPRQIPASGKPEEASPAKESAGELFAWRKDKDAAQPQKAEAPRKSVGSPWGAEKKRPISGDERFSNYFSAGGFQSPLPARQERSVQRNKAIFMIVLVIVVGYIIVTVLLR